MKRLDCVLSNPQWKLLYDETTILYLPRTSSDHHLILIDTHPTAFNFGPCQFWLETMWFNDPSFPNLIGESWNAHLNDIALALTGFTLRDKSWNQNVFGNIFHKKKRLLAWLGGIRKALCFNHNDSLLHLERKLSSDYQQVLCLEEEFWAVKSRTDWTLQGDQNMTFFHLSTICRRHRNKIWCLKDSVGNWSYDSAEIKSSILTQFSKLYSSEAILVPFSVTPPPNFQPISLHVLQAISREVKDCEIKRAVFA
ncbi:uncharacterized protein LOC142640072 [Castanea sativa]|uniref:uncharacterized protein LOC142640072 n=1 Tax=Castanea sativa TaxID=21020 RepID=UPI003F650A8A